jgi:hypothetical protein
MVYNCSTSNPTPTVTYTLTADIAPHTWDAYPTYSPNVVSARWYWGDGTDTMALYPSHTYSVAGTYSICVAAYSACGDSAVSCQNDAVSRSGNNSPYSNMVYINVLNGNQTTGIKQVTGINEVSIYPNPTSNQFSIEANTTDKLTLYLYDVNGRLVLSNTPRPAGTPLNGRNVYTIDVSSLNEGVYTISIISNEGVVNKKLVILR